MTENNDSIPISIRVSEEDAKLIDKIAKKYMSRSDFIRDAIREKIARAQGAQ